jgi:hypothetical protein
MERNHLREIGIDGRIILKLVKKCGVRKRFR